MQPLEISVPAPTGDWILTIYVVQGYNIGIRVNTLHQLADLRRKENKS